MDPAALDADPLRQLQAWVDEAAAAGLAEPNAMVLATVGTDGQPSARAVLCKAIDAKGVVFYTNLESRKGTELRAHPLVAATFVWPALRHQVRVEGRAEAVSDDVSDAYFATRARESQLGAWASPQSAVLADRADLEARFEAAAARFEGVDVPRPPRWGGVRIVAATVELWSGREGRLHDRLCYARSEGGAWSAIRLAP